MVEIHEGRHGQGNNSVVVLYEIDDDLVEQQYERDQFMDSWLPEEGDRLAVHVHVFQLPSKGDGIL